MNWATRASVGACASRVGHTASRFQTIPFSQRAGVTQSVGFTHIDVDLVSRSRGRTLFPGVVAWGRTRNPGADSAARIGFDHDVVIGGQPLAAGQYSVWIVPKERDRAVIFHKAGHVFHTPYPGDDGVAIRLEVAPITMKHGGLLAILLRPWSATQP
ncbi:MAG: DUF2911 domain-containing protein [Gemmatimonadaceae bacterium]